MVNLIKTKKIASDLFYWTEIMEIVTKCLEEYPTEGKEHLSVLVIHIHKLADELLYEFVNEDNVNLTIF